MAFVQGNGYWYDLWIVTLSHNRGFNRLWNWESRSQKCGISACPKLRLFCGCCWGQQGNVLGWKETGNFPQPRCCCWRSSEVPSWNNAVKSGVGQRARGYRSRKGRASPAPGRAPRACLFVCNWKENTFLQESQRVALELTWVLWEAGILSCALGNEVDVLAAVPAVRGTFSNSPHPFRNRWGRKLFGLVLDILWS